MNIWWFNIWIPSFLKTDIDKKDEIKKIDEKEIIENIESTWKKALEVVSWNVNKSQENLLNKAAFLNKIKNAVISTKENRESDDVHKNRTSWEVLTTKSWKYEIASYLTK